MTEITITPIGEPAEHKSKFGFLYTKKEVRHFAQFKYSPNASIRLTCWSCGFVGAERLDYIAKYGDFICRGVGCGVKNFVENDFIPGRTDVRGNGKAWLCFWKN